MKNKLYIFGDSFSVSNQGSWAVSLENDYEVVNFSSNGSSEYRIFKTFQQFEQETHGHKILFCHTAPSRVYLKDHVKCSSRELTTHPLCDLIFADLYAKKEKKFIKTLEEIWDQDFFDDVYKMILEKVKVKHSYHITFFDLDHCHNLHQVWKNNPGNVNHLSDTGNVIAYNTIREILK
jgi:hypothetical protein